MVPPLLELKDVWAVRGGTVALREISAAFPHGARVGLFGTGGSGKTTLLKLIAGLFHPSRGELRWAEPPRAIGMVFQRDALFDSLPLLRNVELPLRDAPPGEAQAAATRALAAVGLSPADAQKLPAELSGGMRKRAGIARALCGSPPVKLYDEPSAGLDPATEREILDLLWRSHDPSGLTVVATSDPRQLWQRCDLVVLLAAGRLAAFGAPRELLGSPVAREAFGEGP
ncbi:MAG TPA: ATP-binding cassette domain-containing protein [Myxococcales bacterium]|nr:ATP-binding cassette domain-containing protein [Myxococcales bacterium]